MTPPNPLVTIGLVCFNHSKYLVETLESVNAQTYENIEILIYDDCSTDNSADLIESWLHQNCRYPYRFFRNAVNKGLSTVCNSILDGAVGKYLAFLATDDIILPNKTEDQIRILEHLSDDHAMCYGDMMTIDSLGSTLTPSIFDAWLGQDFIPPSGKILDVALTSFFAYTQASIIKTDALRRINFRFNNKYISEDWFQLLRLCKYYKVYGHKQVVTKYRVTQQSLTGTNWADDKIHKTKYNQFNMLLDLRDELNESRIYRKVLETKMVEHIGSRHSQLSQTLRMSFIIMRFYPNIKTPYLMIEAIMLQKIRALKKVLSNKLNK